MNREAQGQSVREMFELKNRNYIITGGGRGIGFAATRAIAEMGGNVAVLDRLNEPVNEFNSLSSTFGVKTHYVQSDVTDEESLTTSFGQAVESLGGVDGLITAAGIVVDKPFVEQTWEEVDRIQKVNVRCCISEGWRVCAKFPQRSQERSSPHNWPLNRC